ncbi:DUF3043 domain-containing protein [Canibacter zhoujuaniae]|uniref:DUF3043 domain-containing protein n=1 Tax=Canibacter zhoujuaniae TaxID=2708343 RepID=UPI00142334C2|nr:DUF3043 domain-containing protein [Canibacter zhoujuaniae]
MNAAEPKPENAKKQQGKGRPTPTRKQAQALKARPLVGDRSKAARAARREAVSLEREKVRAGVAAGDERYLTPRDKGPQRKFVRDYVDARWTVGELLLPFMLVVLVLTFFPTNIATYGILALWIMIAFFIVDAIFLSIQIKRALTKKFGAENLKRGYRWYAISRAMQMRIMRLPKPQVKRGHFPR